MKHCTFSIFCLILLLDGFSQKIEFFGGGTRLFGFDDSGEISSNISLQRPQTPDLAEVVEVNGKIWGLVEREGSNNTGIIFSVNLDGSDYTEVYEFEEGVELRYGKLKVINNEIWTTTYHGLFKLNPSSLESTFVGDFSTLNGRPQNGLVQVDQNTIFGNGSDESNGFLYKINVDGTGLDIIHTFSQTDGRLPLGNLVYVDGYVYGTTILGGTNLGTAYKIAIESYALETIHNFVISGPESFYTPVYGLVRGGDRIWGSARGIFSFDLNGGDYIEHHFFSPEDGLGQEPRSIVIQGEELFGLCSVGGDKEKGTFYKMSLLDNTVEKLYDFGASSLADGLEPSSTLTFADSKFWSISKSGGEFGNGALFTVTKDGSYGTVRSLKDIDSLGFDPLSAFQEVKDRIWGLTSAGGSKGFGTIYSIRKDLTDLRKEHDFDLINGGYPEEGLVQYNDKLWGIARGGTLDNGVIYSFDPRTKDYSVEKHLETPFIGELTLIDDVFYGAGAYSIFSFNPANQSLLEEVIFSVSDGRNLTGYMLGRGNVLWGMANGGGLNGQGSIFKYDVGTGMLDIIYNFGGDLGFPQGKILEFDDSLWGSAGDFLFKFDFASSQVTGVSNTNELEIGTGHFESSLLAHQGFIWGTTKFGGLNNEGTIFRLNPDDFSLTKVLDLDLENGTAFASFIPITNIVPSILGVNNSPTIEEGSSYTVLVEDLSISDDDNNIEDFTIIVEDGLNYSFDGTQVFPVADFFGELLVNVRASDGKDQSELFQFPILVNQVLGIYEAGLQLYPNPTEDVIYISEVADMKAFQLFNASGFEIRNLEPTANELDLSELSDGVYFLRITLRNGASIMRKIIKK